MRRFNLIELKWYPTATVSLGGELLAWRCFPSCLHEAWRMTRQIEESQFLWSIMAVATERTGQRGIPAEESAADLVVRLDSLSPEESGTFWVSLDSNGFLS